MRFTTGTGGILNCPAGADQNYVRGMLRDESVACQGEFAREIFEKLLDGELRGLDDGVGVGVVVVVENGGSGKGAEAEARFEGGREFGAVGAGPEIDDGAVGEDGGSGRI